VLSQYAEAAYARELLTTGGGPGYLISIFAKLGLPPCSEDHRRVRAVSTYLNL
jgi:hypothetical protein